MFDLRKEREEVKMVWKETIARLKEVRVSGESTPHLRHSRKHEDTEATESEVSSFSGYGAPQSGLTYLA